MMAEFSLRSGRCVCLYCACALGMRICDYVVCGCECVRVSVFSNITSYIDCSHAYHDLFLQAGAAAACATG